MRTCCLLAVLAFTAVTLSAQDTTPPTLQRILPATGSTVVQLNEIEVLFTEEVQGVDAGDLLINGVPATGLSAGTPGLYRFTFPQPATGPVAVEFAIGHGITDLAPVPNAFAGDSWSYTLNPALALYQVRINEFMSDNQNQSVPPVGIRDEDGTFQDWIELYNAAPIPVNLDGCYLTDRKDLLTQWRLPAFTMSPNTYLIVWASSKNRTNAALPLHTNFRLNNDGEYLGLIDPTGTNVISAFDPAYPAQRVDTSYGRDALDPNIVGYYPGTNASPGRINVSGAGGFDFAPDVTFSRDSSTFSEGFDLVLSTPSPTAVIRYVLVSTAAAAAITNVPTATNTIYTGPIRIDQTTQVRARAFEPGKLPGTPSSESYIHIGPSVVNFSSDLPLIIIHNYGAGTLSGVATDRSSIIASFSSDLDRSSLTNAPELVTRGAANDRGSSTGGQVKNNIAVEFWDEFNQDFDQPLLGMPAESDWVLYSINGFDPGMMHNAIFHWFGRNLGRYSSRTRYVEVFQKTSAGPVTTNDYWGVYLLMEKPKRNDNRANIASLQPENTNAPSVTGGYLLRIDRVDADERTFTTPTFNVTNFFIGANPVTSPIGGQSIIVDYPNSIQWATDPRRAPQRFYIQNYFTNFIRALTGPNWTDPNLGYAAYIDVDSWIENHIANTICFNVDGYRLSGYFFKDRDGKIEQGPPWDCDRCLGTGGSGGVTPQTDGRCFNPRQWRIPVTGFPGNNPDQGTDFFGRSNVGVNWWDRVFRDPDFWQRWIDRYQQYRTNQFTDAKVLAMIDGFYEEIKEAQVREQARWAATFTYPRSGAHNQNGYAYNFGPANPQFTRGGYFTNEVNFQKQWLMDRLNFMDTNFLAMPVLTNGTGLVPSGTTVTVRRATKAGSLIYYTLDGTDPRLPGGGIAPGALSSATDLTLTITGNVRLFARSYNLSHANLTNVYVSATSYEVGKPHINSYWSGPVAATFYTSVPPLRITEIMYHPADPPTDDDTDPDDFEYLEVKNIGDSPLNVNKFRLRGGVDFDFPNQTLAAGEHAVIVKSVAAFQARYGGTPRILGSYTNDNLNNTGEGLVLEGGLREPILDFAYNDAWYPITDGPGFSLQIINDAAPTDTWGASTSWRPSGVVNGTPGAPDPGATAIAAVYVNEVLPNTDPSPTDAIELYNSTGADVNIGGWFLTDNFGSPKKYRIPDNTMIPANGYLSFVQNTSFGVGATGFGISSRGEEVYVFSADAAGNLTGWHHGFDFGAQANGVTFGRHIVASTGEDQFPVQSAPTLGAANAGPQVGPIVISEINYHPTDLVFPFAKVDNSIDEYIELHNLSASPAPLYDPAHPANTWRLRDAVDFNFPSNVVIPAGGFVLVVSFNPNDAAMLASFRAVNNVPESTPVYGPWSGQLDNSEDSVELARPDVPDAPGTPSAGFVPYILVERVRYRDTAPWPTGFADGLGASIGRVNVTAYGNDPANWQAAIKTPGAPFISGGTAPVVTTQPVDAVSAETFSATFSITATGTQPLVYQWLFNGEPIRVPSSPVLTLTGLRLSQAGQYSCLVFSPAGITNSEAATLTVRKVAVIAQQPASRSVFIKPDPRAANLPDGTNVTFSVVVNSENPPVTYQWRFNGTPIPGATGTSLTVTNVQLANEGNYSVGILDDVGRTFGEIFSSNARLTPLLQPVIVQAPLGQTFAEGSDFSHSVLVTGNPTPFGFSWRRGSAVILSNNVAGRSNLITLNSSAAGLTLTNNQTSSNYLMRLVIYNEATTAAGSPGVLVAFTNIVLADFDRDGIPDVVENGLGLDTNNAADGALDLDGDGMKNRDEYIAGTDPVDPASYLKIEHGITPGLAAVQVAAISNRTYTVQYTDAVDSGAWSKLGDIVARPNNRVENFIDPTWTTNRFYRVVIPARQ